MSFKKQQFKFDPKCLKVAVGSVFDIRTNYFMGKHEIISMFGATAFGALWQPISLGVTIFGIGVIFGNLFNLPVDRYVPFLCVGMILWQAITSICNEASDCLNSPNINHTPYYLLVIYPIRVCFKHLFLLFLNLSIFAVVAIIFDLDFGVAQLLLFALGIGLFSWIMVFASITLALIGAIYKDTSNVIKNLLNFGFFVTPIMWEPASLDYRWVFNYNPLFHLIEIVRMPLLSWQSIDYTSFMTISISGMVLSTATLIMWSGFCWLIPYRQ